MSLLHLLFSELRYRWVNSLLSLLAVATASMLFVAGPTIVDGFSQETTVRLDKMQAETDERLEKMNKKTRRIMRDIGVNLRIVHKDTNLGSLYTDFQAHDFPEKYVKTLAEAPQIETIVHLVATLQHKMKWRDRTVLLVGVLPRQTDSQKNAEKKHMITPIKPGMVQVGHELGVGIKAGDKIEVLGETFEVELVHGEFGGLKDVQLLMHLGDAQRILGKEGKINQIMALSCKCKGDRLSVIRKELEGVLPDTKITEHRTRATAREHQRDLVEKTAAAQIAMMKSDRDQTQRSIAVLFGVLTPVVVLASSLFVGVLTWLNVRERRVEIGVLRALGKGGFSIASLFIMRAILTGLLGGVIGASICFAFLPACASLFNDQEVVIAADYLRPSMPLIVLTIIGAPLVSAMAGYLPALLSIRQDPAIVLMDP